MSKNKRNTIIGLIGLLVLFAAVVIVGFPDTRNNHSSAKSSQSNARHAKEGASGELRGIGELETDGKGFIQTRVGLPIRVPFGQNFQVLEVRPNNEFICAFPGTSPDMNSITRTRGGKNIATSAPAYKLVIVRVTNLHKAECCNGTDYAAFKYDMKTGLSGKNYFLALREGFFGREAEIAQMRALSWSVWRGMQAGPAVMTVDGRILQFSKCNVVSPATYQNRLMDLK